MPTTPCRLYGMTEPSTEVVCAACGTRGTGKFCSNCGASLEPGTCTSCGSALSPGARFCPNCGKSVSGPGPSPASVNSQPAAASSLPWIVAAIALVVLLAFLAGSAFNRRRGSSLDAPQNALPQAGLDDRTAPSSGSPDQPVRGPDISQLSPQERADRLFNRVMVLNSEGKNDSVLFFAPMAIEAYRMLSPLNEDQRYDLGRIAEVAGALPLAKAQADSILAKSPSHLLGLILAARIATLDNRASDKQTYEANLRRVYDSESAKKLPEYERHAEDIQSALATARRR